jgi:AcrR family transcriptional regulator
LYRGKTLRRHGGEVYGDRVPRLWNATIDEHRRTVHAAILDAAAALTAQHGLAGVTMSQIAAEVGIGRATLYNYFPDVEAIVLAWHERQVTGPLEQLRAVASSTTDPAERLRLVLRTYADLSAGRHQHSVEFAVPLHRAVHMHHARRELHGLLTEVIRAAAEVHAARTDMPAGELATFSLHALAAGGELPTKKARERLVTLTLAALGST